MWKKAVLISALSLLGLYIVIHGTYIVTSQPKFCSTCHEVKPYVVSWETSTHKDVTCLDCHEPRGALGGIHSKTRGLNYVFQQATGNYTTLTKAVISDDNCLACHLGDYKGFHEDVPQLKNTAEISHYKTIKNNQSCITCHRETGHAVDILLGENLNSVNSRND